MNRLASRLQLPRQAVTLASISIEQLQHNGIKGMILDLDNTIVSEDDRYLSPHAEDWIQQVQQQGMTCVILSNGKRKHRVVYWSNRLGILAISPARKPFPQAFRAAMRSMGLRSHQVVVIGDSRHTDLLGAWWVGCPSIQVASLPHPPRWWERAFGQLVQLPYPETSALWRFDP